MTGISSQFYFSVRESMVGENRWKIMMNPS